MNENNICENCKHFEKDDGEGFERCKNANEIHYLFGGSNCYNKNPGCIHFEKKDEE